MRLPVLANWVAIFCLFSIAEVQGQRFITNITSPGFPAPYDQTAQNQCNQYNGTSKEQLSFVFRFLYLNRDDSIGIFVGKKSGSSCAKGSPYKSFKGSKFGETLAGYSTSDTSGFSCIEATFKTAVATDNTTVNKFHASVYAYQTCPAYSSPQILDQPALYLASEAHTEKYPSGDCGWEVKTASDTSQRFKVQIETLIIASGHYLSLYPIDGEEVRYKNGYKGTNYTSTNQLKIRFYAVGDASGQGFLMSYILVGCRETWIPTRENAVINNKAAFYDSGHRLQYVCNPTYQFESGAAAEYVYCDGRDWSWQYDGTPTNCTPIVCPALADVNNGNYVLSDDLNGGSVASFSCSEGYNLYGSENLTCSNIGEWEGSETLPQCLTSEPTSCAPLLPVSNGVWNCVNDNGESCTADGSEQRLVCKGNFAPNSTSDVAVCNSLSWSNSNLRCQPGCCPDISEEVSAIPNLSYVSDGRCYKNKLLFSCSIGYTLVGQAERTCGNSIWEPQTPWPTCKAVDCGPPPTPDESTTIVSYNATEYRNEATYSCKDPEKYELSGPAVLVCQLDQQWSYGSAPICKMRQCLLADLHIIAPGGVLDPASDYYYVDDNATLVCGNITAPVTCSANGWLGANVTSKPCSSALKFLGSIASPGFPSPYKLDPTTLFYEFTAMENERIVYMVDTMFINVNDTFKLSDGTKGSSKCDSNFVKGYIGSSMNSLVLNDAALTPSNQACSEFTVVGAKTIASRYGFFINVYALNSCPTLEDSYAITEPKFYIASPNYPYVFPTGRECHWLVAPEACSAGQRVAITIEYLNTAFIAKSCLHPLSVGPIDGSVLQLCGVYKDLELLTDGCVARVHFDARAAAESANQGFFISYRVEGCSSEALPLKNKAVLMNPETHYPNGYVAIFRCETGYYFRSGTLEEFAQCATNDWNFIGVDTQCSLRYCEKKIDIPNGQVTMTGDGSYGSSIEVTCNEGYELVGDSVLNCTASGAWSAQLPSCVSDTSRKCTKPIIPNGSIFCEDEEVQTFCSLNCNIGYNPSTEEQIICSDGVFQPVGMTCLPLSCPNITDDDPKLQIVGSSNTLGSLVEFYCPEGYGLDGPTAAICSESGDWVYADFGFPSCMITFCDAPPTGLNLEVTYYSELTYLTLATYSCASGLQLVGDDKLKCGPVGQWIGTLPYCVQATCNPKELLDILPDATVEPTSVVQLSGTANVTCSGSTVQVVCSSTSWVLDPLYLAGCLPNTTESALTLVRNSTSPDYPASYNSSIASVTASTYMASTNKNRIVFVTRDVRLGASDVLTFHMGSASGANSPRCSSSPSQLLRSYAANNGQIFDVIYSSETACTQFTVAGEARDEMALGYYFDTFEIRSCPSVLYPATLTENQFVIVSPNYPRNYVPLESCSWNIIPASCDVGQLIKATVEYADIGPHLLQFRFDAEPEFIELNGTVESYNFQINGCNLNVLFDASENVFPGQGFEFSYKVSGCAEKNITIPTNSIVNWPQGPYEVGTLVTFECMLGMQFTSGANTEIVECTSDGTWKPVGLQSDACNDVKCPVLPEITNGETVPETVTGDYGTTVTFKCNDGFVLIGPSSITCQADGKWSGNLPACVLPSEIYDCGMLFPPNDGDLIPSNCVSESCQGHGTVMEITCDPGYQIDGETNATTCTNGTWIPPVDCTKVCCANITTLPQPANPANVLIQTGSCYLDEVLFACDVGYLLSGSENIMCKEDGQWSSVLPSCKIVTCPVPLLPANESLVISVDDISYGSMLNYSCKPGYYLVGQSSATCQEDGRWSGVRPQCEANQCDIELLKSLVPDLVIEDENPPYFFKDTVSVSCGENKLTVTCAEYGWDDYELITVCLAPTVPTQTTLRVITTQPTVYETPRYVMNVTSPNYPYLYPVENTLVATSVSNGAVNSSKERVVFFVKVANLRSGDSLKLYSRTSASATACYDSNALKTYTGTTPAGTEFDYVVTSTNVACYLFELAERDAKNDVQPLGFLMDVYSLADCPGYGSNYKLQPPSFSIASPSYPSNFPLKQRCEWNIDPPCSNQKLKIQFEDFDVRCTNVLEVQGNNMSDSYCGSTPDTVVIDGCSAQIRFDTSTSTVSSRGFKLVYSLVGCAANQLESRPNATYTSMDFYGVGSTVNYTCDSGTRFKSGKEYERVYCDAFYQWLWLDDPSDCELVTCPSLSAPEYGSVNVTSDKYNGVAYFSCQELYKLEGNDTLVCTDLGTWSSPPPTCRPEALLQCPAPPVLANSELTCISGCNTEYLHGTTLQATCLSGYETSVSNSNRTIRCNNGTWVPSTIPDCTRICCEPFENIISAAPPPTSGNMESTVIIRGSCYNETVDFKCPKAYSLAGLSQSICRMDKTWSYKNVPYCQPAKCRSLSVADPLLITSNCDTFGCSAAFSCKTGYNLVGGNLITCGETGDWGALPKCVANECLVRDLLSQLPPGASVKGSSPDTRISYPNTVTVTCYKTDLQVPCGANAWDVSGLCWRTCEPDYCSVGDLQEILNLANARLMVSSGTDKLADGQSADVACITGNSVVARATCQSVSWQLYPDLSAVAEKCKALPATGTQSVTTRRTEASAAASTTLVTTRAPSVSSSSTGASTNTDASTLVAQTCDNSAVIGLAVCLGILALLLIALLAYGYWQYIKAKVPSFGKNSEENPAYHDMDTFSQALKKVEADTEEQVEVPPEKDQNSAESHQQNVDVSNKSSSNGFNDYDNIFTE